MGVGEDVLGGIDRRHRQPVGVEFLRRLVAARALDLDDLGPGIGQQHGAIGAGDILLKPGNPQP